MFKPSSVILASALAVTLLGMPLKSLAYTSEYTSTSQKIAFENSASYAGLPVSDTEGEYLMNNTLPTFTNTQPNYAWDPYAPHPIANVAVPLDIPQGPDTRQVALGAGLGAATYGVIQNNFIAAVWNNIQNFFTQTAIVQTSIAAQSGIDEWAYKQNGSYQRNIWVSKNGYWFFFGPDTVMYDPTYHKSAWAIAPMGTGNAHDRWFIFYARGMSSAPQGAMIHHAEGWDYGYHNQTGKWMYWGASDAGAYTNETDLINGQYYTFDSLGYCSAGTGCN